MREKKDIYFKVKKMREERNLGKRKKQKKKEQKRKVL